jgi:lysophospholipid acyltransferase (LPLAT)-like uncharacterized protein
MARTIRQLNWGKQVCTWILSLFLRAWYATLRIRVDPLSRDLLRSIDGSCAVFFWHNRLFVMPRLRQILRPRRRMYGLVSASRDGAWLSSLLGHFGIGTVRGSSSWRGTEALRHLRHCIRDGDVDVVVTPDGPRGPRRVAKRGGLLFARSAGLPLLLIGVRYSHSWILKSWDRFAIPKPFSRVDVSAVWHEATSDSTEEVESLVERTTAILNDLSGP